METIPDKFQPNFFQKLANTAAAFGALPLALSAVITAFIDLSSRDKLFEYLGTRNNLVDNAWMVLIPLILVSAIAWEFFDRQYRQKGKPLSNDKIWYTGTMLSRYLFAIVLSGYGFAKLLGTQFSTPYLAFGTELGDLDGSMVTVAFFSYSPVYGNTIGILQILCSVALLFRQTARLALFMLLPILLNILFIDFTFDGWEGPRVIISTLTYIVVFNLCCDFKEIRDFFLAAQSIVPGQQASPVLIKGRSNLLLKLLLVAGILFFSFHDLNKFKKAVTYAPGYSAVLDGAWSSEQVEQYDDSLRQFQQDKTKIGFFVGDQAAVLKRLGESKWYYLNFDVGEKNNIEMVGFEDTIALDPIKGKYSLINKDSLHIIGKEGNDSIRWIFKRKVDRRG